jgi:S-DNA-T family DNA segregation ATPase FtsK/SpoIIIE
LHKYFLNIYYQSNHIEIDITNNDIIYLGSNPKCTICIPSKEILKKELKITKNSSELSIESFSGNNIVFKGKKSKNITAKNCEVFVFGKKSNIAVIPIIFEEENNVIEEINLSYNKTIYFGSNQKNNLIINNKLLSSVHGCIEKDSNNNYIIKDLKSKNRIFMNSRPITSKILNDGDNINVVGLNFNISGNKLVINPKGFKLTKRNIKTKYNTDIIHTLNSFDFTKTTQKTKISMPKLPITLFKRSPRIIPHYENGIINIENPPQAPTKPTISWLQVFLPLLTMGIMFYFIMSRNSSMNFIFFSGAFVAVTSITSVLTYLAKLRSYKKECNQRKEKYFSYLKDIEKELEEIKSKHISALSKNFPNIDTCIELIEKLNKKLWDRNPIDFDFLDIMLGKGVQDFPYQITAPTIKTFDEKDELTENAISLQDKYSKINNTPIILSIKNNSTIGLIGDRSFSYDIIKSIIIQLSTFHSYDEVKIVCIYSKRDSKKFDWVRWIPHTWNNEKTIRYMTNTKENSKNVLNSLNELLTQRKYSKKERHLPYYVAFISNMNLIKDTAVYDFLIQNNSSLGLSTIFIQDRFEMLPKDCHTIIESSIHKSVYYERENSLDKKTFDISPIDDEKIEYFSRTIAPIVLDKKSDLGNIPAVVKFLNTYEANNFETINILNNWNSSRPYLSLSAPIGLQNSEDLMFLDLHEKGEGPHGLVAGTTGSGKSELLQSIILSLAINYHPHDLVFLLIDYKGGGMANYFTKLPHLVGTITNLTGSETQRALLSIKSELKNRQRIFSENGVNNIDDYLKLYKTNKAKTPIPHLIVISDEFAELKQEQPEFMRELVSAARVGRSLGIHLILATQKPSGIVDDQIWSNSRFKLCLKVQSTADSSEVLKRPDAAYIKNPGRCFMQVGNDELFKEFQSSWSGAAYKSEKKSTSSQVGIVSLNGNKITLPKKASSDMEILDKPETELEAGVKYIHQIAEENNITKLQGPWLNPLKEKIYLKELYNQNFLWDISLWDNTNYTLISTIGTVDDPANQRQFPLKLNISNEGNIAIYGSPSTGKTTLLKTLITSLLINHTPDELNIYIIDFGGMTLNIFSGSPHFGGIIFINDEEKINKLIILLSKEISYRKKALSKLGVTSLKDYNIHSKDKIPNIVLIIDNVAPLRELYPEVDSAITSFLRETSNLGINIIMTASSVNEISFRVTQYIKTSIALNLNDKSDYTSIVGRLTDLEPGKNPGRGLIKFNSPLEFQTALPTESENDLESNKQLNKIFVDMSNNWKGKKAVKIPILPKTLLIDNLLEHNDYIKSDYKDDLIPYGLNTTSLDFVSIDLKAFHCFLVSGAIRSGKSYFLNTLTKIIQKSRPEKADIFLIDAYNESLIDFKDDPTIKKYINSVNDFSRIVDSFMQVLSKRKKSFKDYKAKTGLNINERKFINDKFSKLFLIIDDFQDLIIDCPRDTTDNLNSIIHYGRDLGIYLIIACSNDYIQLNKRDALISSIIDNQYGIALGATLEKHDYYNTSLSFKERSQHIKSKECYSFEHGETTHVKLTSLEDSLI